MKRCWNPYLSFSQTLHTVLSYKEAMKVLCCWFWVVSIKGSKLPVTVSTHVQVRKRLMHELLSFIIHIYSLATFSKCIRLVCCWNWLYRSASASAWVVAFHNPYTAAYLFKIYMSCLLLKLAGQKPLSKPQWLAHFERCTELLDQLIPQYTL